MRMNNKNLIIIPIGLLTICFVLHYSISSGGHHKVCANTTNQFSRKTSVLVENGQTLDYDRDSKITFIGGVTRSGLGLVRSLLEAHEGIHCREESMVMPKVLQMRTQWKKSAKESLRLEEAGMSGPVLDSAFSALLLEVFARLGQPSTMLCNQEPHVIKYGSYLKQLFPAAKFLFVVRDARATIHSMVTQGVTHSGYDLTSYEKSFEKWNNETKEMYMECESLGPNSCLILHYELLVLQPKLMLKKLNTYLKLEETKTVEIKMLQVLDSLSSEDLTKWVGIIPSEALEAVDKKAPMLKKMGYDPLDSTPDYSKLRSLQE